jgi:hypothetical protein
LIVIHVTFFPDVYARAKSEASLTPDELVARIAATTAPSKEELPLLSLASFGTLPTENNSLRWNGNINNHLGLAADYDGERLGFEEAVEKLNRAKIAAIVYTSPSHTPEKPRWRVVCWFSQPLSPAQTAGRRSGRAARLRRRITG